MSSTKTQTDNTKSYATQPSYTANTQPSYTANTQPSYTANTQPSYTANTQPSYTANTQPSYTALLKTDKIHSNTVITCFAKHASQLQCKIMILRVH